MRVRRVAERQLVTPAVHGSVRRRGAGGRQSHSHESAGDLLRMLDAHGPRSCMCESPLSIVIELRAPYVCGLLGLEILYRHFVLGNFRVSARKNATAGAAKKTQISDM